VYVFVESIDVRAVGRPAIACPNDIVSFALDGKANTCVSLGVGATPVVGARICGDD